MNKTLKKILLIGPILGVLLGLASVYFVAPYFFLCPQKRISKETPADFGLSYELMEITTQDELTLKGFWIKSQLDSCAGAFILLHGIGGNKAHFTTRAAELTKLGYDAIVYDSRAHGESEGDFCTYGYYEKKDVSAAIDLIEKAHPGKPIGIWGSSFGGAVGLQVMAYDDRIGFGIIESTYTRFSNITHDYKKRIMGFGIKPLTKLAVYRSGQIGGFDPDSINPIDAAAQITQPILLVHGTKDVHIIPDYAHQNFEAMPSKDKELYLVKGAKHHDVWKVGGQKYKEKINSFILDQTKMYNAR